MCATASCIQLTCTGTTTALAGHCRAGHCRAKHWFSLQKLEQMKWKLANSEEGSPAVAGAAVVEKTAAAPPKGGPPPAPPLPVAKPAAPAGVPDVDGMPSGMTVSWRPPQSVEISMQNPS